MWKECPVSSSYLVSDEGEVKNKKTGKILKQKLDKSNCLLVDLSFGKRGVQKYFVVSRLIAKAFVPNPDNLPYIRHIDGNTINNEASNLEWVRKKHSSHARGENTHNSKLTQKQVDYCRKVYKPRDRKFGLAALARKFNVCTSTMYYLLNNFTYK